MALADLSALMRAVQNEATQSILLTGHFFGRLFRNETVDFEDQMKERLIVVLVALALVIGWSSNTLLFKYQFVPDVNRSWQEKNYIFTLMMIFFGLITVLEWDVLFPDRQDFLNLSPLPIKLRTIFISKLASFIAFVGLFSLAMSSMSSVLFSMYLTDWRANSLTLAVRYVVSHVVSAFAANFVVFFGCIFLQFFLMALLPEPVFRRFSILVRSVLFAALVFLLLGFIAHPGILGSSFYSLDVLKSTGDPFVFRYPPLWFVGLYEVLLGTSDPIFIAQAKTAGMAIAMTLLAFVLASLLSYHRHIRRTVEYQKRHNRIFRVKEVWTRFLHAVFRMAPEERAVYGFFGQTVRSSPKHRMTLIYFLATGSATALIFNLAFASKGWLDSLSPANPFVLVVPIMILFIILAGVRSLVNIPVGVDANWIFQVTETPRRDLYVSGLKKAVLIKLVLPLAVFVLVFHLFFWSGGNALLHAAFVMAIGLVGTETAFLRFRKVPFACSYLPGKSKLYIWGLPYALLVVFGLTVLSRLERAILLSPSKFPAFILSLTAVLVSIRIFNSRFYRLRPLIYEEIPEEAMVGFPRGY